MPHDVTHCLSSCLTHLLGSEPRSKLHSHVILAPARSQVQQGERSRQQASREAVTFYGLYQTAGIEVQLTSVVSS